MFSKLKKLFGINKKKNKSTTIVASNFQWENEDQEPESIVLDTDKNVVKMIPKKEKTEKKEKKANKHMKSKKKRQKKKNASKNKMNTDIYESRGSQN